MAAPYNTRSTRATTDTQQRHYCIVLTNNPRMIQSAQRMLQTVALDISTEQSLQVQQQPQGPTQQAHLPSQTPRTRRRPGEIQVEQQVPLVAPVETTNIIASTMRTRETEYEDEFKAQVQPILQLYLRKTRRPAPINSVFEMSNYVQI